MPRLVGLTFVFFYCLMTATTADLTVFGPTGLNSAWTSYSWSGTYSFTDTSLKASGFEYDILATTTKGSYGGLSLFTTAPFGNAYTFLEFQIASAGNPTIQLQISQNSNSATLQTFALSSYLTTTLTSGAYTSVVVSLLGLPTNSYDRITWFDQSGAGITFKIGEIHFFSVLSVFDTTGLNPAWASYSWSGTYSFTDTSLKASGAQYDILATTTKGSYGGLSLFTTNPFDNTYSFLQFQIAAGGSPTIQLQISQNSNSAGTLQTLELSNYLTTSLASGTYTNVVVNLGSLPTNSYDRISWVDQTGAGITFKIGQINLYSVLSVFGPTGLNSTWSSYSWSGTYSFTDTSLKLPGFASDILVTTTKGSYGALSLFTTVPFGNNYNYLEFQIAGNNPTIQIQIEQNSNAAATIQTLSLSNYITSAIQSGSYTKVTIPLSSLPKHSYDRISWYDSTGAGITFNIGEINFYSQIPVSTNPTTSAPTSGTPTSSTPTTSTPTSTTHTTSAPTKSPPTTAAPTVVNPACNTNAAFTGAEAIGSRTVVVYSGCECSGVSVSQNSKAVGIASYQVVPSSSTQNPRCYITLSTTLVPGSLTVTTSNGGPFTRTISSAVTASLGTSSFATISNYIYGMAGETTSSASYVSQLGVSVSRWGGNEATPYNPSLQLSNKANDWFYYGEEYGSADDFIGLVQGVGAAAFLSVPALDWVADKNDNCYSFPVSVYGAQTSQNGDAGNGILTDGTRIQADPSRCYTPWSTSLALTWLEGLKNKPVFAAIDNEMDIASNTHQDIHFTSMSYNEYLNTRFIPFAKTIKKALPNTQVLGPSSCAWWFYWNSAAGSSDKSSHNNVDFLPWFLAQLNSQQSSTGRLMDYLDIHYYPDANVNSNAVDSNTRAVRLRATRTLWDPTYTDEGGIGSGYTGNSQPNPYNPMLIPRFKTLIAENYPGTKFAITEWNFGVETDISSGLAVTDVLGIFGAYGLDLATYWSSPPNPSAVANAWYLYRDNTAGRQFGSKAVWFNLTTPNPNLIGSYAAYDSNNLLTAVIINKNPSSDYLFTVKNWPSANYLVRHFTNTVSSSLHFNTTLTIDSTTTIVVPAYSAIFLAQIASTGSAPATNANVVNDQMSSVTIAEIAGIAGGVGGLLIIAAVVALVRYIIWRRNRADPYAAPHELKGMQKSPSAFSLNPRGTWV